MSNSMLFIIMDKQTYRITCTTFMKCFHKGYSFIYCISMAIHCPYDVKPPGYPFQPVQRRLQMVVFFHQESLFDCLNDWVLDKGFVHRITELILSFSSHLPSASITNVMRSKKEVREFSLGLPKERSQRQSHSLARSASVCCVYIQPI